MFNYIYGKSKNNGKHPPIGCKYTKYNLVPHFIGDFFVSLYCPYMKPILHIFILCNP